MKKFAKIKILLVALFALAPLLAAAQNPTIPIPHVGLPGAEDADAMGFIADVVVRLLLPIAGIIAVLFLVIGGFQYMFAGANEDNAEHGKKTVRYAITGLVIIILSYVVVTVVVNTIFNAD
jgi:hypothetical protein